MPFQPPAASQRRLAGVNFAAAVDFAAQAKQRFDNKDNERGNRDPSRCKALLKFPGADGPVFWSSKMAIDADGPSAGPGRLSGSQLDPRYGQDRTSYTPFDRDGLPSETVPYIVLPRATPNSKIPFDAAVQLGDVAVVIFNDEITDAICGDIGPYNKIGEASIRVHEVLQCPDPCTKRDSQGYCLSIGNASVDEDVLYFVFPNSSFGEGELTYDNINTKVSERAYGLYDKFRAAAEMVAAGQAPPPQS